MAMPTEFLDSGTRTLARIFTADPGDLAGLADFISASRPEIESSLATNGAVLFRGYGVTDAQALRSVVVGLCGEPWRYTEGSSERQHVDQAVYTSTEYPAQYPISLHNELSYARRWPARLGFCCIQAPESGGQTPLADSRRILGRLPDDLVAEFDRRQVRYLRNLRSAEVAGLGLSWQAVFETDDRAEVERYCVRDEISFDWRDNGTLRTSQVRPATATHPKTGDKVWFNQADQFHPTNLGDDAAADLAEVLGSDELPLDATFGDGEPIPGEMLDVIRECGWAEATFFDWQAGDLAVIDNMLVAHGRMPFAGDRRVLVAMA